MNHVFDARARVQLASGLSRLWVVTGMLAVPVAAVLLLSPMPIANATIGMADCSGPPPHSTADRC